MLRMTSIPGRVIALQRVTPSPEAISRFGAAPSALRARTTGFRDQSGTFLVFPAIHRLRREHRISLEQARNPECRRRDSNPRHADYDLQTAPRIGSVKRIYAQEIWPICERARPSREILGKSRPSWQLVGRSESLGVYTTMSQSKRPTGHLQVKIDKNGRTRSFWAFWRDRDDRKGGRRLGPAHVRDSGRRTARGAVIWRAGHGPKPSPEYLTPKEAQACLETIVEELRTAAEVDRAPEHTLQQAVEGWLTERNGERGLKRSTIAGYEDMFERLFRDLGADTPVRSLADGACGHTSSTSSPTGC
jgi:hypothetical protein